MILENAKWIFDPSFSEETQYACPVFRRRFLTRAPLKRAKLTITSLGCYRAELGGKRIGDFIFAPGWTAVDRVQAQTYDVTALLKEENELRVTLSAGWFKGKISKRNHAELPCVPPSLRLEIELIYQTGEKEYIRSDESFEYAKSKIVFAEFYDGEHYDATKEEVFFPVGVTREYDFVKIVKQQGLPITEQERLPVREIIHTPKGETVLDFGQNISGYFTFSLTAKEGGRVAFTAGETLDRDGNFYNENYREAKAEFSYICKEGEQSYTPKHAFWGFRYLRVDSFPAPLTKESVTAIVVHSDMKRTGYLTSSNPLLNRLFENIVWSQKGNFIDIPSDCPQRDERLGWTGDAQIFARAAAYQFDVEKFFTKWLTDLKIEQKRIGVVPLFVPRAHEAAFTSAGWGEAAVVCPYQMYLAYGNKKILRDQYSSMVKHIRYIGARTKKKYLWSGCWNYGDWLGLDAPEGSFVGSSNRDLIATAYYAHSVDLLIRAGKALGKSVKKYETLYEKILATAKKEFSLLKTQTECVLALHFHLTDDPEGVAKQLAELIKAAGDTLQTGFIGTPYLLHALSEHGYTELAYTLLLQEKYPSWLYSVKQGATTVWEHWDGMNEKGEFWSAEMNSFNHYAYGSVADWVFSTACGIRPLKAGYEEAKIAPRPTRKLQFLQAKLQTRHGEIFSRWEREGEGFRYEIVTPVPAQVTIDGKTKKLQKGKYIFHGK